MFTANQQIETGKLPIMGKQMWTTAAAAAAAAAAADDDDDDEDEDEDANKH